MPSRNPDPSAFNKYMDQIQLGQRMYVLTQLPLLITKDIGRIL